MKCFFLRILHFFVFLFAYSNIFCQVFENTAGSREKHFVYEVKQIDEFFERFNNDENSFIRSVYKLYKVEYKIDRRNLIKSLFNYQTNSWTQDVIDNFVNTALKVQMPSRHNFYGENWFAEALCKFQYNSTEIEIPVILKIVTDESKRSKWVIAAVKDNPVKSAVTITSVAPAKSNDKFITPSGHANYFIELEKVFDDKENLAAYFDLSFFRRNNSLNFYQAILQNHIKFLHVKDIKYHFLQVSEYVFTVEYFQRNTLNSGWLINNLKKISLPEKEQFRKKLLGEQ